MATEYTRISSLTPEMKLVNLAVSFDVQPLTADEQEQWITVTARDASGCVTCRVSAEQAAVLLSETKGQIFLIKHAAAVIFNGCLIIQLSDRFTEITSFTGNIPTSAHNPTLPNKSHVQYVLAQR